MLFCPTGQSLLRDVRRPKKSGKNAAGNGYFVSKVPARQVPLRGGRREGGAPPLASPEKERVFACSIMPPGNAYSDSLLLKNNGQRLQVVFPLCLRGTHGNNRKEAALAGSL